MVLIINKHMNGIQNKSKEIQKKERKEKKKKKKRKKEQTNQKVNKHTPMHKCLFIRLRPLFVKAD